DTAGVDEQPPAPQHAIERSAWERTGEVLERADLVLLVLDSNRPSDEVDDELLGRISGKRVIPVLNKCDLTAKFDSSRLPEFSPEPVQISAQEGMGIACLTERIWQTSGTENFDLRQPVCFTHRQEELLRQLTNAESKQQAASIITDLLKGRM
ncbi:MAG: hypothetical protein JSW59_07300, partial [Phycisphaerales bacterium]